ncbi:hypothetical protein FPZ24_11575 [Sphingomonas panacisoli]|uniref:TonB-dependent receptor-like beta-barrel domain-containing protein n=1 Tax=Sphingomonas panacisoli TaxID=1813879 RepID=A0A5B8LIW8_9SPHN|nr:hypothetical protein [Sphingomonas panacisoli]QDZ08041.1 hypothetical protein FPZ24_11575 [Sphingomonas panacisoli]
MRSRAVRHAGRCIGLVAIVGVPGAAYAQDVQTSVVASVGGSAESNPYNDTNSHGAAVAATADVRGTVVARDDRTTVDVTGWASFRQFLRRYGLEDSYGVNTDISSRQSDRLTLRGSGSFSYSVGGFSGYGRPSLSPVDPTSIIPDPTQPDPLAGLNPLTGLSDANILGQRTRFTSYGSGVGADMQLGARSSASLDLSARALRFALTSYDDYNTYSGQLQLNHRLDELFSVGLIGTLTKTNYLSLRQGDARTAELLASVDRRLGSHWSLNLGLGASFTKIDGRGGLPDTNFTALSARLRFCWQDESSNLCLGALRSPQPAADGNVRVSDTLTADYSLRLSARENLSVSGAYSRTGRGRTAAIGGGAPAIDFVNASVRYDNQISKKLTAFVASNFSKSITSGLRRRPNVGISMGLQVRIGTGQ